MALGGAGRVHQGTGRSWACPPGHWAELGVSTRALGGASTSPRRGVTVSSLLPVMTFSCFQSHWVEHLYLPFNDNESGVHPCIKSYSQSTVQLSTSCDDKYLGVSPNALWRNN